jgi:hypothetical protein
METTTNLTFGKALDKAILEGRKIRNAVWNGLNKQEMFVAVQHPDENSRMTKSYLYMQVNTSEAPSLRRPRVPSMLDLFSDTWEVLD